MDSGKNRTKVSRDDTKGGRGKPHGGRAPAPRPARKVTPEISFDTKSRFEYLRGFSARKDLRKKKGNLKNLKKQLQQRKDEQNVFRSHVQDEYKKALHAVEHNIKIGQSPVSSVPEVAEQPIEAEMVATVTHFQQDDIEDPFGNVSVQVVPIESPDYARVSGMQALDTITLKPTPKAVVKAKMDPRKVKAMLNKKKRRKPFKPNAKKTKTTTKHRPGHHK